MEVGNPNMVREKRDVIVCDFGRCRAGVPSAFPLCRLSQAMYMYTTECADDTYLSHQGQSSMDSAVEHDDKQDCRSH